jgi:5-methylthioribose kinase
VFSPHQIYYDSTHYIIVMEDLSDHHILRGDLIQGVVNPQVAENIAQFMAITHSRTHTRNLTPPRVKRFIERFDNHVMQGITADYIFTKPFIDDPTNFYTEGLEPEVNAIKADSALRNQIQRLKEIFSGARQGLTHGDLHTGSVMVKGDSTKVIDSEFVFYGSVGFDIGLYWANYWLSYFSHAENTSVRSALKSAIQRTWEVYISAFEMADEGRKAETLNDIFHESIGFAGMEVMRRIIGAAHVCDIEGIADIEKKLSAERAALAFGGALVKHHRELLTMADVMTLL